MPNFPKLNRRFFLASALSAACCTLLRGDRALTAAKSTIFNPTDTASLIAPLAQFNYGDVMLSDSLQRTQFEQNIAHLLNVSDDSMLKPYRERAGLPAPGQDIGGWYDNVADYEWRGTVGHGFAPGHCLGQWMSALARAYAITGSEPIKEKLTSLISSYAQAISPKFYKDFRFPAYTYDKLLLGLLEANKLAGCAEALDALQRTTDAALPYLPKQPRDHGDPVPNKDMSWTWDESYTSSENLFIAYQSGLGERYLKLAKLLLLDEKFFDPLAAGQNALVGRHAYSHMNALSSAMQAYLVLGSERHLRAAKNAFELIRFTQSFATGGWGPDETFQPTGVGALGKSLTSTHHSFETPCGSYAHFKLTRYLLRVTRDSRYGDSMEKVMYNTVLGAKPLQKDGRAFYYSDYNFQGSKFFHDDKCPCCAGTLPQVACDYNISTYFHDEQGLFINLYINSRIAWDQAGARFSLEQTGDYPLDSTVQFQLSATAEREFALRFRIPEWTSGATLLVNDQPIAVNVSQGAFLEVTRTWRNGDSIKLSLPMPLRLEAIDDKNPDTVALLQGPLVLFLIGSAPRSVTRKQLVSARRNPARNDEWLAATSSGLLTLRPFTSIADEPYSTYVQVSG